MRGQIGVWAALLVAAACGAGPGCVYEGDPGRQRRAVVGGVVDEGDPAAVMIGIRRVGCDDLIDTVCSGTLIGPRVVLSAAHCFEQRERRSELEVLAGTSSDDPAAQVRAVVQIELHPDYDEASKSNDLALLLLDEPLDGIEPAATAARALLEADLGISVRLVGFGEAETPDSRGVKRTGTATVDQVAATIFRIAPGPAMTCNGDSGGAVLADLGDGERVVGVTSIGDPACTTFGSNTQVAPYIADFVQPFLDSALTSMPPPRPERALDQLCESSCTIDLDCPAGMACISDFDGARICGRAQVGAGWYGAVCADSTDCQCVRLRSEGAVDACRCFEPCAVPPEGGCGCASESPAGAPVAMLLLALFVLARLFRVSKP
jgi:MYXO-CTERM domain-containing protein